MNKCILQRWEESERGWGVRPDGASLHINIEEHKRYIDKVYEYRLYSEIPDEYERIIGNFITVYIEDSLFRELIENRSLRLSEIQLNNLINLDEMTLNQSEFL
jgi:hypothetical protein